MSQSISEQARLCPVLPNWSFRRDGTCKLEPRTHRYYNWRGNVYPVELFLREIKTRRERNAKS